MCVLVKQEDSFIAQNRQQNSGSMKARGILQLIPVRAEIQLKNLHILAWWGWGYDPSLPAQWIWNPKHIPLLSHCFHKTSSSHCILHSGAQKADRFWADCAGKKSTPCLLIQATKVDPLLLELGSEEGGHCYSAADETKRPSPSPCSTSCSAPYTKSHITLQAGSQLSAFHCTLSRFPDRYYAKNC